MSDLYLPEGWLNIEYLMDKPAWLIVIIGKRQVGKTYGVLQAMLRHDLYHILLRRTTAELDLISASPDLNPYKAFEPEYHVGLFKSAKSLCRISHWYLDDNGRAAEGRQCGIATSLAQIAHMRGFDGSAFSDLVFDEFIPEKGVITRTSEGDSFLNAHKTISGNREFDGGKPLRTWLLANTNNINSSVLSALELTDDVLYMRRKGLEELLTPDGTLIVQPNSEVVTAKQKQTKLMQRVNSKSDFYKMAVENEWSYDESPYVKTMPLKNLRPVWSYDNAFTCWETPSGYYVCRASGKVPASCRYDGSRTGRERLEMEWSVCKLCYYAGCMVFSDLKALAVFKTIFGID